MERIEIKTSSKQYPLYIGGGIRFRIGEFLEELGQSISSVLIITDKNVSPLYLDDVVSALHSYKNVSHFVVEGNEGAKSFQTFYECHTYALESELDRSSVILALGGGVIGDLAGFIAATYMRGIPFIQIPTTLLAHDSSVGGKVAINHPLGKNMIGAFHQPEAVIYDIDMLKSLPKEQWRSGFAEVMKHSLIWDRDFYRWLKEEVLTLNDLNGEKLQYAIKKGILVKAAVVSEDETEKGIRSYLNFGHTLAHALEAELGYGRISHGDAVAMGMLFAIRVSEAYYSVDHEVDKFRRWFKNYGFPVIPSDLSPERLLQLMKKDKKVQSGSLRMVLMKDVGQVETVSVDDQFVLTCLKSEVEEGGIQ